MMKKKAFTLIETVIVVLIIGILSTILVKSYIQMSQIAFRVEQEKNVTQEVLLTSEVLQNYADRNKLDFKKYEEEFGWDYLKNNKWLVDILYLTGIDGAIAITTQGEDCLNPGEDIIEHRDGKDYIKHNDCRVQVQQDEKIFQLTNPKKVQMTKLWFKIIPYASYQTYFEQDNELCESNFVACPHQPGFWVLWKSYSTNYGIQRSSNVMIPFQQFFSLQ